MSDGAALPTMAILTALPKEHAAVSRLMLDSDVISLPGDTTLYRLGTIPAATGVHHVVLACLPKYGNNTAGITTTNIIRSFPSVKDVLMVGICAGVPRPTDPKAHVRLGDVVVSSGAGVAQFDFGADKGEVFEYRATPPPPSARLLQAVNLLESELVLQPDLWRVSLAGFLSQAGVQRPRREPPHIFRNPKDARRTLGVPRLFRGIIGASNTLMKNPVRRDQIAKEHNLLALEMEGSGVADATWDAGLGYLLVRGVCDYGDQGKDDSWQEYAAHTAAAYAQALLLTLPGSPGSEDNGLGDDGSSRTILPEPNLRAVFAKLEGPSGHVDLHRENPDSEDLKHDRFSVHLSANRLTVVSWIAEDLLACGGFDDRIYWVDLDSGELWGTRGTGYKLRTMVMVGAHLICGDDGGQVTEVVPGENSLRLLCRGPAPVYTVAYHAEKRRLYTGDRDGNIVEWGLFDDPWQARRLSVIERMNGSVFSLVERNGYLIAGDSNGEILERDLRSGKTTRKTIGSGALFALDASNDLATMVTGSSEGTLHELAPHVSDVPLHEDAIRALLLAGHWVLTSSKDGMVKAHNLATGATTIIWSWHDYGYGIAVSPSKMRLAMVSGGGEVAVLELPRPLGEMNPQEMDLIVRVGS